MSEQNPAVRLLQERGVALDAVAEIVCQIQQDDLVAGIAAAAAAKIAHQHQ